MKIWTTVSLAALVAASGALAQDDKIFVLDPIYVETARGDAQALEETTVSTSVVTSEEIEEKSTVNTQVGDILGRTVPGMAQSTENMTEYGQSLRGRNFLALIDGIPQTNTLNNDYRALNSIGLSAVEQVEVVRGATAAYGFGGAGGQVNVITKSLDYGEEIRRASIGLKLQEENVADSLSYSSSVLFGKKIGDFDYLFSLGVEDTGGSFTANGERRPPDSFGSQGGLDDVRSYNLLAKVGYDIDEVQRLEFSANIYDYKQDSDWAGVVSGGSIAGNTSATPSAGDLNTKTPGTENKTFSFTYKNEDVFGGSLDLQLYHNDRLNTFTQTEFASILYPQYETESQKTGLRATFDTPISDTVDVVWGLDYINDKTIVNPINGNPGTPDMTMEGYAPFAQLTYGMGALELTGGLRYEILDVEIADFVNSSSVPVTGGNVKYREPLWNISAAYDLTDSTTVFGGYSETFQLGGLSRALADSTFATVDTIDGDGQRTESYELGIRGFHGAFDYSAAVFQSDSNAGETYDSNLNLVLAPERIRGVELTANYQINSAWKIGGTASFIEGEYDTTGDGNLDSDLGSDRIAPTKLTAYVAFAPNDWSNYRLDVLHSGSRNPDSSEFTGLQNIESYTVINANASYELGKGRLDIGISNLLDEDYAPVLMQSYSVQTIGYDDYYYVKAPGRTISARYTVDF